MGTDRTLVSSITPAITPAHDEPAAAPSGQLAAQLRDVTIESATQHVAPLVSAANAVASAYPAQEVGLAGRTARALVAGGDAAPAGERRTAPVSARRLADEMLRMVSPFPMALLGDYGPVDGTRHVPVQVIQDAVRRLGERHPDAAEAAGPSPRTDGPAGLLRALTVGQIAPMGPVCEIRPGFASADGAGDGFDIISRACFPVALGRLAAGPYPLDFDAASPGQGGVRFVAGFPVGKPQDYGGYRLDPGFAAEAADLSLTFPDLADAAAPFAAPPPPEPGAGARPVSAAQAAVFARLYRACHADQAMMTAVSGLLGVTKAIYGLVASTCDVFRASDDLDDEADLFFVERKQYLRLAQHPDFTFEVADGPAQEIVVRIRAVYPVAGYRGDPAASWRVAHGAGESRVTFATSFAVKRSADADIGNLGDIGDIGHAAGREKHAQRETAHWLDRLFAADSGTSDGTPGGGGKPERIRAVRGATTMSVAIENRWRFDPLSGNSLS
ncbi:MAG: hypothetical protein ACRYHA_25495 [Janthinobacterium lividum]